MDYICDPSLVLYLPLFDLDGSSLMSRDACGHLCSVTGATLTPEGRNFDGNDDYLEVTSHFNYGKSTLLFWLYANSTAGNPVLAATNGGTNTNGYIQWWNGSNIRYYRTGDGAQSVTWNNTLPLKEWHFLALVGNGVQHISYADGLMHNVTGNTTNLFGNYNLQFGRYNAPGSNWFNGKIGEIFIYNRALTPPEIRHNYLVTKWRYK